MPARRYLAFAAIISQVAVAAVVAGLLAVIGPTPGARAATYADGATPATAAASCWEIKQGYPSKPSGLYWIVTPAMPAPLRLYCDQVTDGGGWVMVARGRQGWTEAGGGSIGSGTWPSTLPVDGSGGAMLAKQLSGATIDSLVNNGRIDALADGIRLRRAANTAGTSWQEVRVKLTSRDRWSWALSSKLAVKSYKVNSVLTTVAQTFADLRINKVDNGARIWTSKWVGNGYVRGFNYGATGPRGTTSATSYLYSTRSGGTHATPFTQMYLRPKLIGSQLGYARIPDGGSAAVTNRPVVQSQALPNRWGVTGLGAGGSLDTATEVSAFLQIGSTMYVGGNFTTVRDNQTGRTYAQPYLAAFDATTGDWIPSFRPQLNNQVKALANFRGQLAVGGQFTRVNNTTRQAVTVLAPSTGAIDTRFYAQLRNSVKGSKLWVRSLLVADDQLYVGGQFTEALGGTVASWTARNNLVRLRTDGRPDAWAPNLGTGLKRTATTRSPFSSVNALTTRDGILYVAGFFAQAYMRAEDNKPTITKQAAAAITMGDAATFVGWTPRFSDSREWTRYQQTVLAAGPFIWLGGSQHVLSRYRSGDRGFVGGNITSVGGDFQSLASANGIVYGGCHCNDWNYSNTTAYEGSKLTGYDQVDRIGYVGAWDANTGKFLPEFAPTSMMRNGEGPWALTVATDGTLWSGGDYTSVVTTAGSTGWAGGFVRFPVTPSTAPAAPSNLRASAVGNVASLAWNASSTPGVSYEVLENDRVVAFSGAATSIANIAVDGTARFFVRAVDVAGNRSASTPVRVVTGTATTAPPAPAPDPDPVATTLLPTGSSWSISLEQDGDGWKTGSFAGTYTSGKAPIGWGNGAAATTLAGTPNVAYVRREFTLSEPGGTVTVTTRADDGAAVYVNGTEVARRNLPAGTLTGSSRATASPSGTSLDWTFTIPAGVLTTGKNLVAVEMHRGPDSSPDGFFDLSVTQTR